RMVRCRLYVLHAYARKELQAQQEDQRDRFRAMTDEELADFLEFNCACPPRNCPPTDKYCKTGPNCKGCWLDWIRTPAEEET
ncbi:MAG: hypothetical protein ACI4OI_07150, partial [Gemmiger sp.]